MVVRLFTKPNIRRKLMYVFICVVLSHDFLLSIALYFSALSLCPCLCRRLSHFHLSLTFSLSLTHTFCFCPFFSLFSLSLSISLFLPLHTLIFEAVYDQLELTKPSIPRSKPIFSSLCFLTLIYLNCSISTFSLYMSLSASRPLSF